MRIHALLFFLFSQSALALYGGAPVTSEKHLVKLQVASDTFCLGVVIAPTKVLTTGHCIEDTSVKLKENPNFLTYYPETVSVRAGSQVVRANTITFAPTMFDAPDISAEDLALVELSTPLKNVEILPFALKSDLTAGKQVILSANGKEAMVAIRNVLRGPDSLVLITNGSVAGVCQGDSGGALILVKNGKRYLAGILAAQAQGCARRHSVSYFPRREFNF